MINLSTSTKSVHYKLFSDISLADDQSLKRYHGFRATTPLSKEIGISVDPTIVTWIYQVFQ